MRSFVAAACLFLAASPAEGQSRWREHLDPSRLREARDSFAVKVGGTERGWQRVSAVRTASGWELGDAIELTGMVRQQSVIAFSPTLVEQGLSQEGQMGPQSMRIVLRRADGRIRGSARTPTGGPAERPVDVAAGDEVIDDNAVTPLLPAIRWAEGLSLDIPVLASGKGTIAVHRLRVTGRGPVTVPAGTFDAWQVTVAEGERAWMAAWVTTAAPYRVLRVGPPGGGMVAELVR